MKRSHHRYERTAIDLLEEAVHLLRLSPGSVFASYYVGSLPFVLGLLYFWADMSQSAFARERVTAGAFALALLFFWMKLWQTMFARQLGARISGRAAERWTWREMLRTAGGQIILQPSGLFLLPIALVVTLPFGWVYAFYQNVTVLGGRLGDVKTLWRAAARQAQVWPAQNHLLLGFISLGSFFVFLNLGLVCFQVPQLLKTLFGVQTVFTQHPFGMLNSTLVVAVTGLTYLCIDPLVKAAYALRCYYGEAIESGEDLKSELHSLPNWQERAAPVPRPGEMWRQPSWLPVRRLPAAGFANSPDASRGWKPLYWQARKPAATGMLVAILWACTSIAAPTEPAASPPAKPATPSGSVPVAELDDAIETVLNRPEFSWRMPRVKAAQEENTGMLARFVRSALDMVGNWCKAVMRFGKKILDWLAEKLFSRLRSPLPDGTSSMISIHLLVYFLLALVVAMLAVMALRMWHRRRPRPEEVLAAAIPAVPDLEDEHVSADQLPEESWLKLGRELTERGELRLALRAFYLAGLAHLGYRELIRIARFKSNREYEFELGRRARNREELLEAFAQSVKLFDRVWYGKHDVSPGDLRSFQAALERITTC